MLIGMLNSRVAMLSCVPWERLFFTMTKPTLTTVVRNLVALPLNALGVSTHLRPITAVLAPRCRPRVSCPRRSLDASLLPFGVRTMLVVR